MCVCVCVCVCVCACACACACACVRVCEHVVANSALDVVTENVRDATK